MHLLINLIWELYVLQFQPSHRCLKHGIRMNKFCYFIGRVPKSAERRGSREQRPEGPGVSPQVGAAEHRTIWGESPQCHHIRHQRWRGVYKPAYALSNVTR